VREIEKDRVREIEKEIQRDKYTEKEKNLTYKEMQ
jgi:hypothetical protein